MDAVSTALSNVCIPRKLADVKTYFQFPPRSDVGWISNLLSNVDSWENELSVARIELVPRKSLAAKWKNQNVKEMFWNLVTLVCQVITYRDKIFTNLMVDVPTTAGNSALWRRTCDIWIINITRALPLVTYPLKCTYHFDFLFRMYVVWLQH